MAQRVLNKRNRITALRLVGGLGVLSLAGGATYYFHASPITRRRIGVHLGGIKRFFKYVCNYYSIFEFLRVGKNLVFFSNTRIQVGKRRFYNLLWLLVESSRSGRGMDAYCGSLDCLGLVCSHTALASLRTVLNMRKLSIHAISGQRTGLWKEPWHAGVFTSNWARGSVPLTKFFPASTLILWEFCMTR